MKAVEWAALFQAAATPEDTDKLLNDYGNELAELIEVRTKFSKDKSVQPAAQGAISESRNKFSALMGRVPSLNMGMFDLQVVRVAARFIPKPKQAQEEKKEAENADGRNLVKKAGGNPNPKGNGDNQNGGKQLPQRGNRSFQSRNRFGGPRPQRNDNSKT